MIPPVFLILAILMLSPAPVPATGLVQPGPPAQEMKVLLEAGQLTLEVREVPLSEVLIAIGNQAGFETVFIDDFSMPVSASFNRVPVWEVLDKLTYGINKAVSYRDTVGADEPEVSRLWLLGVGSEPNADNGENFTPDLTHELQHVDAKVRGNALLRLANQGATFKTIEALSRALEEDPDPLVRSRAAMALGTLGDAHAVSTLESSMLHDEHASVRIQATQALGQIGGERAVQALGETLINKGNKRQRIVAAWGLARHNTEQAKRFLELVMDDPDKQIREAALNPPIWVNQPDLKLPFSGPEAIR